MELEKTKIKATCFTKRRKSPRDVEWILVNIFRKQILFSSLTNLQNTRVLNSYQYSSKCLYKLL
jgi:hypothetical protein